MDWIPAVFVTFKAIVLATGMFFAVKWHYDQEMKKGKDKREVLRTGGKLLAVFVLALVAVGLVTYLLIRVLGM
jgi:heme A synthase